MNKIKKLILDSLGFFLENTEKRYLKIKDVINDLNTDAVDKPLSSSKGKDLADRISTSNLKIGDLESLHSDFHTDEHRPPASIVLALNKLKSIVDNKANIDHSMPNTSCGVGTKEKYGHVKLSYELGDLETRFMDGSAVSTYTGNLLLNEIRKIDTDIGAKKLLWSGAWFMGKSHIITLSQSLSSQRYGIVLVWSGYDVAQQKINNTNFWYTFVPKWHIQGAGIDCTSIGHWMSIAKYVYVDDKTIKGHEFNDQIRTAHGITFENTKAVLRFVYGI